MELLVGIGDLHGRYDVLDTLMKGLNKQYEIFESEGLLREGIGVEFNGDFVDRGPESLKVLEYAKGFCERNPAANAKPGNHELLALGDLDEARDILRRIDSQEILPEGALAGYQIFTLHGQNGGAGFIDNFGDTPYIAFSNYVRRMSKGGDLGDWIRELEPYSIREIRGTKVMFTHSDLTGSLGTEEAVQRFREDYRAHMQLDSSSFPGGSGEKYDPQSPLIHGMFWDRGFRNEFHLGRSFDDSLYSKSKSLVDNLGVDYLVVGHTPQINGRILNIGGRIFNIDVYMWGNENPAAIVFDGKKVEGFYVGEETKVVNLVN